jgi:peptide/nickel transport system permease protein
LTAPADHLNPDIQGLPATHVSLQNRGVILSVLGTPEGRIGTTLGLIMISLIVLGPFFAPYSPTDLVASGTSLPSPAHLLGTDQLGRDVLSRVLHGGASVLLGPIAAIFFAYIIGVGLGVLAAYRGRMVDAAVSRAFDFLISQPSYLIILVSILILGNSPPVLIATVAVTYSPWIGRVAQAAARPIVASDYVLAAQARGESTLWIVTRELLPNMQGQLSSALALDLTSAIIAMATLSFLGLGAQPPSSNWGLMVAESQSFISVNPWATLAPAIGIALLSVVFTLLADGLTRTIARDRTTDRIAV